MYCGDFIEKYKDELLFNLNVDEMDLLIGSCRNRKPPDTVREKIMKLVDKMGYWDFYAIYQDLKTSDWDK